jgi:hypothetical protein
VADLLRAEGADRRRREKDPRAREESGQLRLSSSHGAAVGRMSLRRRAFSPERRRVRTFNGMGEHSVEWSRDGLVIEGIDQEAGVADLAAGAAAHEPPKLLLGRGAAPRRHLLQRAEPTDITVGADDLFDGHRTERPDQLILQILDAHIEPELLHSCTGEVAAETGALQCPTKDRLLPGIAKAGEPQAIIGSPELLEEGSDSVGASEPNDPNPRRCEVDPPALSQRFDRQLIARAFDDNNRAHAVGLQTHRRHHRHTNKVGEDLEGIGRVRSYFVDIEDLAGSLPPPPDPTWPGRLGRTFDVVGRGLPYMLGVRRRRRTASPD